MLEQIVSNDQDAKSGPACLNEQGCTVNISGLYIHL